MTSSDHNTVFLRLEGPLQSWGVSSRFVIRDTADEPTKSGILGLVCCAMGLRREVAKIHLPKLNELLMGVRVDRPGVKWADYHTVGAGIGVMKAAGKIKFTETTDEIEAVVSRRFFLSDASFLVALQGGLDTIAKVAQKLQDPDWPPFLGRKSCPPAVPIFAGTGRFDHLEAALTSTSQPWRPRLADIDGLAPPGPLRAIIECRPSEGRSLPEAAIGRMDEPVSFFPPLHRVRYVVETEIACPRGEPTQSACPSPARGWANYQSPIWKKEKRPRRLRRDWLLCVLCKRPAEEVHHVDYFRAPDQEDVEQDLRSLCKLCHGAITMLEYGVDMGEKRIDPLNADWRERIIAQRAKILRDRIPMHLRKERQ